MRTITTLTNLYSWDELSPAARERAKEYLNQMLWDDGTMGEDCQEEFDRVMEVNGWDSAYDLTFQLYSQSGMPKWGGTLTYAHGGFSYNVSVRGLHYGWIIDVSENDGADDDGRADREREIENLIREELNRLSVLLLNRFESIDLASVGDAIMADLCETNEYEFLANGNFYGAGRVAS